MFVDDLLLIARSTKELEEHIQTLTKYLIKHFAIETPEKTEILARRNTPVLRKYLTKHKLFFKHNQTNP